MSMHPTIWFLALLLALDTTPMLAAQETPAEHAKHDTFTITLDGSDVHPARTSIAHGDMLAFANYAQHPVRVTFTEPPGLKDKIRCGLVRGAEVGSAPTVVAFWASYCAPCRAEVPAFNRAARRWRARGLRVVGVALETDEERVRDARQAWGIEYDVLRIAAGQDDLLERLFPQGLPVTAFVARGEVSLDEHVVDDAELDRRAPSLLGDAPPPPAP